MTVNEMVEGMKMMEQYGLSMTEDEVRRMFSTLDSNGTGEVDYHGNLKKYYLKLKFFRICIRFFSKFNT